MEGDDGIVGKHYCQDSDPSVSSGECSGRISTKQDDETDSSIWFPVVVIATFLFIFLDWRYFHVVARFEDWLDNLLQILRY